MAEQRSGKASQLPFDLAGLDEAGLRALLHEVIKAQQQNNDTMQGDLAGIVKTFNKLAGDVKFISDYLGVNVTGDNDVAGEVTGGESYPSHDELEDVSADDHHNEAHTVLSTAHSDSDSTDTPASGDSLVWDGTKWTADFIDAGDSGTSRRRKQTRPYALFQEEHDHDIPFAPGAGPGPRGADGKDGRPGFDAVLDDHEDFGMWVPPTPGTGGTADGTIAVQDDTTPVADFDTLDFGTALTVTDNLDGSATIDVTGSGSTIDVEDDTTPVGSFSTLDFGGYISVVDDGGGHATIEGTAPGGPGGSSAASYPGQAEDLSGDSDYGMWVPEARQVEDRSVILWSSAKRVGSGTVSDRIYPPFACVIQEVFFTLPGSTTSAATVDVKKNGTSIFPTIAKPTTSSGYISSYVVPDTQPFARGDYLTVHVTSAGSVGGRIKVYIVTKRV